MCIFWLHSPPPSVSSLPTPAHPLPLPNCLFCVCVWVYVHVCAHSVCPSECVFKCVSVPLSALKGESLPSKEKPWVPHCGYPLGKLSLLGKRWGLTALSPSTAGITGSILWQFPLYYFSPLTIGNFVSFSYNALQVTELEVFGQTQISLLVPLVSVPVVLWVGSAAAVCCLGVADILKVMS